MAIVFPASPSVNDTFTAGSITYKWDGDKWIGLGVTPADRLIEGSNSLEIDANNDLVWTGGGDVKLTDGNVIVASGHGIDFSANDNTTGMSSELLDDYEEGSWTPRISFAGGETGITYSVQTGNYTKIGRQVTVTGYLTLSNKGTSTGELRIEGLPFTVRNDSGAYNYSNMYYQNILPSNIHTGKEIMTGGTQWFSSGYFGVDKAYQLNNFEVYTHVRFRRVQTSAYSWCLLFVTSDGGSPATYTSQFAAVINVPSGGVIGEEIIMPFLNAPGDASVAAGTNQGGVQMLYGAPATDGTPHYIAWLSGDGGVGNNTSGTGAIFVSASPTGGNIDYIQVNTTPTVGQTYGPVTATDTGTDIHISVFRDGSGGWCGPQTGNLGGFVEPNNTNIRVRTIRNSITGHGILTDVSVVNTTQLGAFSWTYFTDL